jgi:radical SAM protein
MSPHPLSFASLDFAQTPFLAIWEVTQACPLVCQHCRAEAQDRSDPNELTLEEGKHLLDQIKAMGTPVCVLSGGDPLRRQDLTQLIRHGADLGLRMATIPVASQELTRDHLAALQDAGIAQVAFSLDGATAELHDSFRQVPETFARTVRALEWGRDLGLAMQINTTFARFNRDAIDALIQFVEGAGIVFWEVFSLVPVGRGTVLQPLSADEHEVLFGKLYELSKRVDFIIKLTEAPHYRRYVLQQRARGGEARAVAPKSKSAVPAQLSRELSTRESFGSHAKGINSGKGFCFISHTGEVFPSGFFPVPVGNVRERPLADLYRNTELFRELRNPKLLRGRCGACEFADVCGGSRARALATQGDYLAEDPACGYVPAGYQKQATGS